MLKYMTNTYKYILHVIIFVTTIIRKAKTLKDHQLKITCWMTAINLFTISAIWLIHEIIFQGKWIANINVFSDLYVHIHLINFISKIWAQMNVKRGHCPLRFYKTLYTTVLLEGCNTTELYYIHNPSSTIRGSDQSLPPA
jgi:hypothetical protein